MFNAFRVGSMQSWFSALLLSNNVKKVIIHSENVLVWAHRA